MPGVGAVKWNHVAPSFNSDPILAPRCAATSSVLSRERISVVVGCSTD